MLLKSIKLGNIRSYINEEINFPEGSLLLSGDIGTGKSSILLAVEFALFGILRGDLSGSALLRNGAKEGFVELTFEINQQRITIRRKLKRNNKSVEQDSGYIISDGVTKIATAQELKVAILDLLGYPRDLLTKSKSLIYRYTVYTPQEDMKKIIFDDKESRLDILRKVFDVDKYKRIQENASTYAGILRGRKRELGGIIADLEDKKKQKQEKLSETDKIEGELRTVDIRLNEIKLVIGNNKDEVRKIEEKAKKLTELKNNLKIYETEIRYKEERITFNDYEIERLKKQIADLEKDLEGKKEIDLFSLSGKIKTKNQELQQAESRVLELKTKLSGINTSNKFSEELKNKIVSLATCPVCLQEVNQLYKKKLAETEDTKIKEFEKQISEHNAKIAQEEDNLKLLRAELEDLRKKERDAEAIKVKLVSLKEKVQSEKDLTLLQEKTRKEVNELNEKKLAVLKEIDLFLDIEEQHSKAKKTLENNLEIEKEVLVIYNKLKQKKEGVLEAIKEVEREIERKEAAKQKLEHLQKLHSWIEDYFENLVKVIEKKFMAMVYNEFNELFCKWMDILVESGVMQARLDDSFTPVIQQNGYDVDINNLSGGEKTACALAYRLALNKVINGLMTSIKTKDLLILDEPTDGFSTEQLDKIREVLDELQARQVLIVSHENKIESFVDNVIRVHKHEHVSSTVQ